MTSIVNPELQILQGGLGVATSPKGVHLLKATDAAVMEELAVLDDAPFRRIRGAAISSDRLYVEAASGFVTVDISQPTAPVVVAQSERIKQTPDRSTTSVAPPTDYGYGPPLTVEGNRALLVASEYAEGGTDSRLYLADVSDFESVTLLDTHALTAGTDLNDWVARDGMLYLITTTADLSQYFLRLFDWSGGEIVERGVASLPATGGTRNDIVLLGDHAIISSKDRLWRFDVSDPDAVSLFDERLVGISALGLEAIGDSHVLLNGRRDGLEIYDVSGPAPALASTVPAGDDRYASDDAFVDGDVLYYFQQRWDVSDPQHPVAVASFAVSAPEWRFGVGSMGVAGDFAFLQMGEQVMRAGPLRLAEVQLSSSAIDGPALGLTIEGRHGLVHREGAPTELWDFSEPDTPTFRGTAPEGSLLVFNDTLVSYEILDWVNRDARFSAYDLSGDGTPVQIGDWNIGGLGAPVPYGGWTFFGDLLFLPNGLDPNGPPFQVARMVPGADDLALVGEISREDLLAHAGPGFGFPSSLRYREADGALFVISGEQLLTIDVSEPSDPRLVGVPYPLPDTQTEMVLDGDWLLLVSPGLVSMLDASTVGALRLEREVAIATWFGGEAAVAGDTVVITDSWHAPFVTVDLSCLD